MRGPKGGWIAPTTPTGEVPGRECIKGDEGRALLVRDKRTFGHFSCGSRMGS